MACIMHYLHNYLCFMVNVALVQLLNSYINVSFYLILAHLNEPAVMVADDKDIRSNFVRIEDVLEEKRTSGRNEVNILAKRRRQLQLSRGCSAVPLNKSSYEFNMSSNVISISAISPTNASQHADVVYNVLVTEFDPGTHKSNNGAEGCSAGIDNHENWVKSKIISDYTTKEQYKCLLLVKRSSKGRYFSWNDANKKCLGLGGNLIKIQTDEEQHEAQKFVTKR